MNKSKSIKGRNLVWIVMPTIGFLLCTWMANSLAQQSQQGKVDPVALYQDTQKIVQKAGQMTLVWWIPEEFWHVSSADDPRVTKEQAEKLIEVLRPYTLIIVIDGKIGPLSAVTYRTEQEIRAGIQMKDSWGNYYRPLSEDKIDANCENFLSIMKPIFISALGPMGQNMHFFLFPGKSQIGLKIVEAKKKGSFSVILGERKFQWRLPLGSLLAPKICPTCKENCSGAWNFCPWCGTRLPNRI